MFRIIFASSRTRQGVGSRARRASATFREFVGQLAQRSRSLLPSLGDQHVTVSLEQQILGHAAEQGMGDTGAAVRAGHQQISR